MALSPFYKTIWLNQDLSVVNDPNVLSLLESPYLRAPQDGGYQDWNLNSRRWSIVNNLKIPAVEAWRHWIPQARETAETLLRDESDLDELCREAIERATTTDEGRFAQLRARVQHSDPETAAETEAVLARERRIAEVLYGAIREPRITLETVAAVFISPHPLPQTVSSHD
jgi:ATP-dependent helicase HepA